MKLRNICVLTATRAEYGLLKPVIEALERLDDVCVRIVATGMHLSPEFGLTYRDIEADGYELDAKIPILMSSDTPAGISKTMGIAMINFADYFERVKPDLLVVLGDRYETLAVCAAALNERIPIAHLYGGETTQGAVDEAYRHAITKMSCLHFTSTEEYRRRVIQLGESPDRVFTVGGTGVENILRGPFLSRDELSQSIGFDLNRPYACVTFHPVTLENCTAGEQIDRLLEALDKTDLCYLITKANADADGRIINRKIDEFVATHDNAVAFESLGMRRYLSALKHAQMVIGNSSSGLLEAPSFGIPTINIGDRQKGRLRAESVIDCEPLADAICAAIDKALSDEFKLVAKNSVNPYGNGNTSSLIAQIIEKSLKDGIEIKKEFYNIEM